MVFGVMAAGFIYNKAMIYWTEFIVCAAVIVYAGTKLSKYGDILAEKTGLGGTWIGIVLMASVTSLPELVTGVSSVTYAGVPDIAVGDVLGSCVFNLLILTLLDALHSPKPISSSVHQGHVLSASFGILLLMILAISFFLMPLTRPIGWIGVYSIINIAIYLVAMRMVYYYEKRRVSEFINEMAEELQYQGISTRSATLNYMVNAVLVVIAASFLPGIGENIAEATGLGQTFVGSFLIALSTSLPEIVISVVAIRINAADMAIGNLFGSNMFNLFILAIDDILFIKGPILNHVSPSHLISALFAVFMTAIAIIGLTYRQERKRYILAWDSIAILTGYILYVWLLYVLR